MVQRRQLLRWAAISGAALALGCRPSSLLDQAEVPPPAPGSRERPAADNPSQRSEVPGAREQAPRPSEPAPDAAGEPEPEPDPTEPPAHEETEGLDDAPATEAASQKVEVICREGLGLRSARANERTHQLSRLTLHHTAVSLSVNALAPSRLRGHQRYHMEQGWSDIAYHFAVDLSGNIYELRSVATPGDTFTDYDPAGHFLVVCEGNFDQQDPTDAMLTATAEILAYGAASHGAPPDSLAGHRDHASTTCPGDALQARLGDLRGEVARLASNGISRLDLCGDEARDRVAMIEAG